MQGNIAFLCVLFIGCISRYSDYLWKTTIRSSGFRFVMAVGILRGRHRLTFADVNRVNGFAFPVDYLVSARLRTNVSAI